MKRVFDVIASLSGLIILSPIFLTLAIWIATGSKGGVFYRQERVGRNGRLFKLYKFRSMHTGSDKKGLLTVGGRDSRITIAGYYLRKYKLDELPQLFNVLQGDMSLVGPRPEVKKYVELYTPEQLKVLNMRPGITDPASITYRNENDLLSQAENPEEYYITKIMPDKLRINAEYISNRSFMKDIQIIIRTIFG